MHVPTELENGTTFRSQVSQQLKQRTPFSQRVGAHRTGGPQQRRQTHGTQRNGRCANREVSKAFALEVAPALWTNKLLIASTL